VGVNEIVGSYPVFSFSFSFDSPYPQTHFINLIFSFSLLALHPPGGPFISIENIKKVREIFAFIGKKVYFCNSLFEYTN